jgi:hypothetical protein
MATDILQQDRAIVGLERTVPGAQTRDTLGVARRAWTRALESCAERVGLTGARAAAGEVSNGNAIARMHCCHTLAEEVAASLRASQQEIQGIYAPYCDSCPQDFCVDKGAHRTPLVHLLIWTQQKSPALNARTAALGNALAQVAEEWVGARDVPSLLETNQISSDDLETLFGAGHRERWPRQLQTYLLEMNEPVEEL